MKVKQLHNHCIELSGYNGVVYRILDDPGHGGSLDISVPIRKGDCQCVEFHPLWHEHCGVEGQCLSIRLSPVRRKYEQEG